MAEIKKVFKNIKDFKMGAAVLEDKKTGDRETVTHISFNVEDMPGEFNDVLLAFQNGVSIDVTFSSQQAKLEGV